MRTPQGSLAWQVAGEGFTLAYLDLAKQGRIPLGTGAVLWLHPRQALLDKERSALNLYLDTGGRLLIAAQAGAEGLLMRSWVVAALGCAQAWSSIQTSAARRMFRGPCGDDAAYTDHPIVARLAASGLRTLLRRAAPIEARNSPVGTLQPLAAASPKAGSKPTR